MRGKRLEDGGGVEAVAVAWTAPPRPAAALGSGSLRQAQWRRYVRHQHHNCAQYLARKLCEKSPGTPRPPPWHSCHSTRSTSLSSLDRCIASVTCDANSSACTAHVRQSTAHTPSTPRITTNTSHASPVHYISHVRQRDRRFCDIGRNDNQALVGGHRLRRGEQILIRGLWF